jgi:hypothetical protein
MRTLRHAALYKLAMAGCLLALTGQAQASVQQRCNDALESANRGANRDIVRVENEIERATGRAVESANSCLARVGDILVRSIPGMPSFSTMSASQVIEMLAGRACAVVQSRASDAAGRVTRPIQTVNQSINRGIGEASAGAGLPNVGRVEIPQGQVSLPSVQSAPQPSDANPAVSNQGSAAQGASVWDRLTSFIR